MESALEAIYDEADRRLESEFGERRWGPPEPNGDIPLTEEAQDRYMEIVDDLKDLMSKPLKDWIEENTIQPGNLEELVRDAASMLISDYKNEGVWGLINFLKTVAGWSEAEIKESLLSTSSSDG